MLFRTILHVVTLTSFFIGEAGAVGLSIQIDPNKPLTVAMARKLIAGTEGGVFLGPDELASVTPDLPRYNDLTGFTGQDILDCPEPCGMFYLPASLGNRIPPTIRNMINDSQGWFWAESFTEKPLTRGWVLVSFRTSGIRQGGHLERLDAVSTVWILKNTPPNLFRDRFYVSDRTRSGNKVIVGRDRSGAIVIAEGARDNFVVDEGVVYLALARFRPAITGATDPYSERYAPPTTTGESRKGRLQREMEESSQRKKK